MPAHPAMVVRPATPLPPPPRLLPRPVPPPAYADGSTARRLEAGLAACGAHAATDDYLAAAARQSSDHHRRASARAPLPPALESAPYPHSYEPRSRAHQRGVPLR